MVIERSAAMMVEELGAPIEMMLDRMLTYAGTQACVQQGSPAAAIAPATIPGAKHQAGNLPGVLTRSKGSR
jgi:hypothetical protein